MIINSIIFLNGSTLWITQAESDTMSADLLAGKTFVSLPRLQKTFNVSQIANVGPNSVFSDPLVAGGEFSFSFNGMWAKLQDKEYAWNKGWKYSRGSFSSGMSFDEYIASTIIA
jgi:hypothetical protein